MTWKHFPHCWPFVRGIHQLPMRSNNKGPVMNSLCYLLLSAWSCWMLNWVGSYSRCQDTHATSISWSWIPFQYNWLTSRARIPIMKMRCSWNHLMFIMAIPNIIDQKWAPWHQSLWTSRFNTQTLRSTTMQNVFFLVHYNIKWWNSRLARVISCTVIHFILD